MRCKLLVSSGFLAMGLVLSSTSAMAEGSELEAERQVAPLAYLDELPPLVDRDLFIDDPRISGAQVSPDGRFMTFRRPYEGVQNIWFKAIDEPFDEARPLTADDRPVPGYFWSQDSRYVLYVQDRDGDEDFHVWAVDPQADPEEDSGVPPARNLTDLEGVRAQILSVPRETPESILVGLNDRDPALHDVYRLNLETGERELVIENDQNVAAWSSDLEGNVRLAMRQTRDGGTEILPVEDGSLGDPLYECSWEETCGPMGFRPGGEEAWFISNRGEDTDLTSLYLMDVATGETTLVETDPEGEVDFGGVILSNADHELLATSYVGDRPRIYPKAERFEEALAFLREELPEGEISFRPQTHDDRLVLVTMSRDVDPGTVYLFDWEEMSIEKLYASRPDLDSEHLAEMEPIRYTARDGLEIPAYITYPKGVERENLAVVALIHGGPWARDTWGYRSQVQFLANRGYAVLQPNFRASTGFGKEFLNAGNNEWGDAMQDDITDGINYLVEQGIADPDRVCIMGGSYGGYATLAGLVFTPDLYACGVNIVGPSNLMTLINSIPAYWGPARKIFTQRMGDPDTEEGREQLERQSPLNHVENISRPMLVVHGYNDPRVRQSEADQLVATMRENDLPVEFIVAPDEGHGFRGRENRLAMYARIEAFLAEHLGGRYQDSMDEDIANRLAEITVDVDTVEMPEAASGLDAARTLPLPTVDSDHVRLGTMKYTTRLSLQGQEFSMELERKLTSGEEDGRAVLEIDGAMSGPMGSITDHFLVNADNLRPIRRHGEQTGAVTRVEYGSGEVTGTISVRDQEIPIDIQLDAPAFGGEAALEIALAGMELEDGFRTSIRYVEVGMEQRQRIVRLEVTGPEEIETKAGIFDTWRIDLQPLDGEEGGQVFWLEADSPRTTIRHEGRLPAQMGGGSFETELVEIDS